jgi:hypothetical protein
MLPDAPVPACPWCKHTIDPKTDILWDTTAQLKLSGVTIVYCGWCGAVLGGAQFSTFSKRKRG